MTLDSFDDLVRMARGEPEPALLLACVLRADVPVAAAGGDRPELPLEGEGIVRPIMVKSFAADAGLDFQRLRAEIDDTQPDWAFIMLAVLPGSRGRPPTSGQVDEQLKNMARCIHTGSSLDRYLFIDRAGEFVRFCASALAQ
ncbi:MAG: hypothetical protein CVV18_00180 [Gammaproteobacteria bacterium HGW-Gammaproteobacteria-8]|nr:MAG: hypothetical protein CVV18_00180 [Gammaproteobacteria bacterium HGW-Gammaproteobacteria-8]